MVSAPAAAAINGAKRRSHSGTSLLPFKVCENINAAATGVPNSAPMVPAEAKIVHSIRLTRGNRRAPIATARAILTVMIGCSGPRLTPPARPRINATISPGSAEGGTGAPISGSQAGSGPACPWLKRITNPTAIPVSVNMAMIQKGESWAIPRVPGSRSQSKFCNTEAIFITTIRIRLDAIPIATAGSDNNNMVLARGWSMFYSLCGVRYLVCPACKKASLQLVLKR